MSQYWIEHKPAPRRRRATFVNLGEQWIVWTRDHKKISSHSSEAAAEAAIARLKAPAVAEPTPTETGWSNAARQRAAAKAADVQNPLGRGVSSGKGYTMYEGADGSGRYNTQIWDES